MLFIILTILALSFTISSHVFRKGMLAYAGTGAWMIAAIQSFILSTITWDVYFCVGFLFIGLTIACSFSPLAWRETTPDNEMSEDATEMKAEMDAWDRDRSQFSFLHKPSRRRRAKWE